MLLQQEFKLFTVLLLALLTILPHLNDCLIITSVLAGDKKFKTISFDSKFIKPLMFESELPTTEFRRHRTVRPPKFDIDINIPIKLPLEDEYPQEEYRKPVENNIFFQTGEINEPSYKKKNKEYYVKKPISYSDEISYAASHNNFKQQDQRLEPQQSARHPDFDDAKVRREESTTKLESRGDDQQPLYRNDNIQNFGENTARSDVKGTQEAMETDSSQRSYNRPYNNQNYDKGPDFIPGGFVNLQLSGPTGGPQMNYEDYDREKWAQKLSQTAGAMPYPILNYHQLQNFYGGLGTFTNGLAENRYQPDNLLDKLKSGLHHMTNKFHIG